MSPALRDTKYSKPELPRRKHKVKKTSKYNQLSMVWLLHVPEYNPLSKLVGSISQRSWSRSLSVSKPIASSLSVTRNRGLRTRYEAKNSVWSHC